MSMSVDRDCVLRVQLLAARCILYRTSQTVLTLRWFEISSSDELFVADGDCIDFHVDVDPVSLLSRLE